MTRLAALVTIVVGLGCQAAPPAVESIATADPSPREISGIGIRPVSHADGFAIGQVFPGGPADQAGLLEGDVVVEVDGDPTARWTLDRTAKRLRGAAGTSVTLVAVRGGERFAMRLERRTLAVP